MSKFNDYVAEPIDVLETAAAMLARGDDGFDCLQDAIHAAEAELGVSYNSQAHEEVDVEIADVAEMLVEIACALEMLRGKAEALRPDFEVYCQQGPVFFTYRVDGDLLTLCPACADSEYNLNTADSRKAMTLDDFLAEEERAACEASYADVVYGLPEDAPFPVQDFMENRYGVHEEYCDKCHRTTFWTDPDHEAAAAIEWLRYEKGINVRVRNTVTYELEEE